MLLTLGFQPFFLFFALFSRALGRYLHFALAVACVPTIPAVETLGRQSPDSFATEIAVGRDLEGLRFEIVILGSN